MKMRKRGARRRKRKKRKKRKICSAVCAFLAAIVKRHRLLALTAGDH
jgi:hypothetical protein